MYIINDSIETANWTNPIRQIWMIMVPPNAGMSKTQLIYIKYHGNLNKKIENEREKLISWNSAEGFFRAQLLEVGL